MTLNHLLEQEASLWIKSFTNKEAALLGQIAVAVAEEKFPSLSLSVSINKNGALVYFYQMDGAREDFYYWLGGKHNVVQRFGHSSLYMKELATTKSYDFLERYGLDWASYRVDGGAFPIFLENCGLIGSIAVSGIDSEGDHEIAVLALERFSTYPRL